MLKLKEIVTNLIYLWTRDASLKSTKEGSEYIKNHLHSIFTNKKKIYSDTQRFSWCQELAEYLIANIKFEHNPVRPLSWFRYPGIIKAYTAVGDVSISDIKEDGSCLACYCNEAKLIEFPSIEEAMRFLEIRHRTFVLFWLNVQYKSNSGETNE